MSQTEIVLSGFGGQGALFAGHILAMAALAEEKHVTWLPSYGPEMRGGTAHCTVIVADEPIGAPLVERPAIAIVLNKPSLTKYEPLVRRDGLLLVNSSLVAESPTRDDLRALMIPATTTAEEIGDARMANIVALGAMLAAEPVVRAGSVAGALEQRFEGRDPAMIEPNQQALERGMELAQSQLEAKAR